MLAQFDPKMKPGLYSPTIKHLLVNLWIDYNRGYRHALFMPFIFIFSLYVKLNNIVLKTSSYLSAEVEVAEQNRGLGAGDEKNDENQEEEPKHVVHLMRPETPITNKKHVTERRNLPRYNGGQLLRKTGISEQSGSAAFLLSYQMLLRMKKSWMKMQPNGRIPPIIIPGIGLVKNDCSGIWRGIWLVRTGCSIACTARGNKEYTCAHAVWPRSSLYSTHNSR